MSVIAKIANSTIVTQLLSGETLTSVGIMTLRGAILSIFYGGIMSGAIFLHYFLYLLMSTGGDHDDMRRSSRGHSIYIRHLLGYAPLPPVSDTRSRSNLSSASQRALNRQASGRMSANKSLTDLAKSPVVASEPDDNEM